MIIRRIGLRIPYHSIKGCFTDKYVELRDCAFTINYNYDERNNTHAETEHYQAIYVIGFSDKETFNKCSAK